jgi:hypothetical protein
MDEAILMPKFRRRSTVVEAVQWGPGLDHPGVHREGTEGDPAVPIRYYVVTVHLQRAYLAPGDWILPEPDGIHFYPCKPEEFAKLYEPVYQ